MRSLKSLFSAVLVACAAAGASPAFAAADWNRGNIIDFTTSTAGVMIRLDVGQPTNCSAPNGWMLIPEANRSMVALALTMWANSAAAVDVYVTWTGGYCVVNQLDPR